MSDDPLKDCPECGKSALTKLVSASSFKLKGTGWYETDFKNKKKADSSTSDNSKTSDSKTSDSSKTPKTKSSDS